MELKVRIEKDGKFYFIESRDYPVFTQGRTRAEAVENFKEAFLAYAHDQDAQMEHPELRGFLPEDSADAPALNILARTLITYGEATHLIRQRIAPNFM